MHRYVCIYVCIYMYISIRKILLPAALTGARRLGWFAGDAARFVTLTRVLVLVVARVSAEASECAPTEDTGGLVKIWPGLPQRMGSAYNITVRSDRQGSSFLHIYIYIFAQKTHATYKTVAKLMQIQSRIPRLDRAGVACGN